MSYSQKLQQLRDEVIAELSRQVPTIHDNINLFDKDDEENRDDMPLVNIHHKHYVRSEAYAVRLERKDLPTPEDAIHIVCEDTETGNWESRPTEWFTTGDLCEVLDRVIEKVKERKN